MKNTESALLAILRAALHAPAEAGSPGPSAPADPGLTPEEWQELLRLAEVHKLLPVILDAAWSIPSCRAALRSAAAPPSSPTGQSERREESASPAPGPSEPRRDGTLPSAASPVPSSPDWRDKALEQAFRQAIQENELLDLILDLRARGLEPVVTKGPVCRALWPKPLLRPSLDDDLLVRPEQLPAFHTVLQELGLTPDEPYDDFEKATDLCYRRLDSLLFVELNSSLFDPGSDALLDFNKPFDGAMDRAVPVQIQDVTLLTLAPTDHLLYLILHAFKHFLYGGFGLRIVGDICLYARHYAAEIDFERIAAVCAGLRCDRFTAAVFRIGERYLDLSAPEGFALPEVDETALLEDVMEAGLHGETIDRLRSANITLGAVADRNAGRAASGSLRKALFPGVRTLAPRYPWLEKRPWLLPAAWAGRFWGYFRNRGKYGEESAAASLRIGKERVELLKTYGVIDE